MVKPNKPLFVKNLTKGLAFEEVASAWIKSNFKSWWITDCRLHTFKNKGPRMTNGNQELVLPDFRLDHVSNPGEGMWIDAKLKRQPAKLPNSSSNWYSLDPKSYQNYCDLMQTFPHMPFWILLGCEHTRNMYMFKLDMQPDQWHQYNNQYVTNQNGLTPMFDVAKMKLIDKF